MKILTKITNFDNHQKYLHIKSLIRDFMAKENIVPVEVPVLSPCLIPETYLDIFETTNIHFDDHPKMYLTPSPELFLKRLLVNGLNSCYYLGLSFRNNEPISVKHNHEFTMLEFYKNNASYMDIADITLKLMQYIAKDLNGTNQITYQGVTVDLTSYEKITVADSFKKYAQINNIFDHDKFFKEAESRGYDTKNLTYVDLWSQIYGIEIEPHLGTNGKVTLIYDYPAELAAMVNIDPKTNLAQRFEIYVNGIELGNCGNESTENTNIEGFKKRLQTDSRVTYNQDSEFIDIIQKLPPCSGIAIGVDRLAMVLINAKSIQDMQLINLET